MPETRLEAATAIAGAAVANTIGAKLHPRELLPVFKPTVIDQKKGIAAFRAWVDAHNSGQSGYIPE